MKAVIAACFKPQSRGFGWWGGVRLFVYSLVLPQQYKVHPERDNGNLTCSGIACAVLGDGLSYFTMDFFQDKLPRR